MLNAIKSRYSIVHNIIINVISASIIIQSFCILFFENILIKNIIMYSTILIGIRRIVIRTDVPSNISKNTLFSYKGIIAINKNDKIN